MTPSSHTIKLFFRTRPTLKNTTFHPRICKFTMATSQAIEVSASTQPSPITNGTKPKTVYKPRYIDIGINLTDPVFTGLYHGEQRHPNDLSDVIRRAKESGCEKLIVTGSDLEESRKAVQLARDCRTIYATIGVHPCNCLQFTTSSNPSTILSAVRTLALEAKTSSHAVAFGEIGLDYDRLSHCPKDIQLEYFEAQLDIAVQVQLPLFLHSRAAHSDFLSILSKYEDKFPRKGVVHSFTGTKEEMLELVERGWDIGINGCSMKTVENCEVVKMVPLDRLQLETDGPWCEIRASHTSSDFLEKMGVGVKAVKAEKAKSKENAKGKQNGKKGGQKSSGTGESTPSTDPPSGPPSEALDNLEIPTGPESTQHPGAEEEEIQPLFEWPSVKKEKWARGSMIKGRNEPCMIGHVAWAVAGIKGISVKEVADAAWRNSERMFGPFGG